MASLLSKLSGTKKSAVIEPREIFMALPKKDKKYEYPRDVQSDVWKKWFEKRNDKNSIIKMNTGSGKTVVGLMILQSCLNEGKGPAVYVVPDKYLVNQVCEEAELLGISVAKDKDDYSYAEKKGILVTTIHSLINGRSVFGMRNTNNYPIGSVLLDDVHACLDTITAQFSLKIPSNHELYKKIIGIFSSQWKDYNSKSYTNIVDNREPTKAALVPFWIWQDKQSDVYKLLSMYNNNEESNHCIYFHLPLIEDTFATCDCFITARGIEIIPEGISISKIKSFENAQRRIFMSATLSDDSVFTTALGLCEKDINGIITPDNANDIGDRLILFPRHLNSDITDDDIKEKIKSISQNYNVIVIVPSSERAEYWDPYHLVTVNKDNIEKEVAALKAKQKGFHVLVNRYDGVDLPDDACRVLVIDRLPPLRNEKDKYIQCIDPSSAILRREQIQRIEQGMGRGVRSNSDSCVIILMGDSLADVLLRNNGIDFFSNATKEQYMLSKDLWDLLKQENSHPNVDEVFELTEYSLMRDVEWIQKSKERLSEVKYSTDAQFDHNTLLMRQAYDYSMKLQYQRAINALDNAINSEIHDNTKGYLMQVKAKYFNFIDKSKAQQILLSGKSLNISLVSPIEGIRYDKSICNVKQAKAICENIRGNNFQKNSFVLYTKAVSDKLVFSPDADEFESALQEVGKLLGFKSTRPDKETDGEGPDNLWATGDNEYFVIECKSGADSNTISKDYCNQLGGSIRWFYKHYGQEFTSIPIMVHKSQVLNRQASAVEQMRIMNDSKLKSFKNSICSFATAVAQDENWMDEEKIDALLDRYNLRGKAIIEEFTVQPRE